MSKLIALFCLFLANGFFGGLFVKELQASDVMARPGDAQTELNLIYQDLESNLKNANQRTAKIRQKSKRLNASGLGSLFPFLAWDPNWDTVQFMVDEMKAWTLAQMQDIGLMVAKPNHEPWSDSYWPIYLGSGGYRYADPQFPASSDWKENSDYVKANLKNVTDTDLLSPAEKYDLYVGDEKNSFTLATLNEGKASYETHKLQSWEGHCHGWSPASFMLPRPKKAVNVKGKLGHAITFYPSDIKALETLLWASAIDNGLMYSRYSGRRCNEDNSQSPECLDVNPAIWHQIITNQIGANKGNVVMDIVSGKDVWNQPILSYKYFYFNPDSKLETTDLSKATKNVFWWNDGAAGMRAPGTVSVVGVIMDVEYLVETRPSKATSNSKTNDAIRRVRYIYDLEQDWRGNLIGGLWYKNEHPDFIWNQKKDDKASGPGDALLADDIDISIAAQISGKRKMPLAKVVDDLLLLSNTETPVSPQPLVLSSPMPIVPTPPVSPVVLSSPEPQVSIPPVASPSPGPTGAEGLTGVAVPDRTLSH